MSVPLSPFPRVTKSQTSMPAPSVWFHSPRQLAFSSQRSGASTPQRDLAPPPRRPCSSPSIERRLRESLFSSGRSSWSSGSSETKNDGADSRRGALSPPPPPRVLRGHRPNFLPLRRLACSLSPGHATSSSQTSPGSVGDVGSPVSFAAEIEALSSALPREQDGDVPPNRGVTTNPGACASSSFTTLP